MTYGWKTCHKLSRPPPPPSPRQRRRPRRILEYLSLPRIRAAHARNQLSWRASEYAPAAAAVAVAPHLSSHQNSKYIVHPTPLRFRAILEYKHRRTQYSLIEKISTPSSLLFERSDVFVHSKLARNTTVARCWHASSSSACLKNARYFVIDWLMMKVRYSTHLHKAVLKGVKLRYTETRVHYCLYASTITQGSPLSC